MMVEKANDLKDLYKVFKPEALDFDTMASFYCGDTMSVRTGDPYVSPIKEISDDLHINDMPKAYLFMGHKGCGKSTELNKLKREMEADGYKVAVIKTALEVDMQNLSYIDLLILMAKNLIEMADQTGYDIDHKLLEKIETYWNEKEDVTAKVQSESAHVDTSAEIGISIPFIVKMMAKGAAEIKYGSERRKVIRKRVEQRSSEWIQILMLLTEIIKSQNEGRYPVFILEDLDKMNPDQAWEVFFGYASILSSMPFHIIYTFPISLSYRQQFGSLESYFKKESLPMIKLHTKDMAPFDDGIELIKNIVFLRACEDLFERKALLQMILSTGGSLRDLFNTILKAGKRADIRGSGKIETEDVSVALNELRSDLTKRIESKDYGFLADIYKNKEKIEDREKLLQYMQASVVLEYNGIRWHDIHPLVIDFLKDQKIIKKSEK